MTYAELLTYRATLESALSALSTAKSVAVDGHEITRSEAHQLRRELDRVNRDLLHYTRRTAGQSNPGRMTPKWS